MPGGGTGGLLPVCRSCLCADATVGLVRSEVMNGTVGLLCAVALGLDCLYAVALK